METFGGGPCAHEEPLFERGEAQVALHVPPGFQRDLDSGEGAAVLFTVDGSDTIPAGQGSTYAILGVKRYNEKRLAAAGAGDAAARIQAVELRQRVWFNPELRSKNFFVTGILALLLMLMTMILTSMAIVKEKERGTLESIIVSPMSPLTLVLGKLVPFVVIGFLDVLLVVAVARYAFGIQLRGSILTLLAVSGLFIVNTTGLGLLVSTLSSTQQEAMMSSMFFVMLPLIYLSGFVFPIESMPAAVQWMTDLIPLKHFLVAVRAVFLKGSSLGDLAVQCAWLTGSGVVLFTLATLRVRKRLA